MRRPGQWLQAAAARVCARQTVERVVDPILSDIQTEHEEAMRAGRSWRATWIRISGYSAFWKAVGLHTLHSGPQLLWSGIVAEGWTLGRTIAYSAIAFLGVMLLLMAPTIDLYSPAQLGLKPTLLLVPQAIPLSILIALPLGIVCAVRGTRVTARRIRGVLFIAFVATLLAFAATLMLPVANQAFRVALAEELDMRAITKYSLPRGMSELSLSELAARGNDFDAGGFPESARKFTRAYHIRLAFPAAAFVLSLLALGVCGTVPGRARRVAAILIALFLYGATLAFPHWNASLTPAVSVWAPNILYTVFSLALLLLACRRLNSSSSTVPTAHR